MPSGRRYVCAHRIHVTIRRGSVSRIAYCLPCRSHDHRRSSGTLRAWREWRTVRSVRFDQKGKDRDARHRSRICSVRIGGSVRRSCCGCGDRLRLECVSEQLEFVGMLQITGLPTRCTEVNTSFALLPTSFFATFRLHVTVSGGFRWVAGEWARVALGAAAGVRIRIQGRLADRGKHA